MIFKNAVKRLAKSQFSIENHKLAFKFCVFKKAQSYLQFEKADFLHFQIAIFKNAVPKRFIFCDLV
jgi:hypothetical protein